MEPLAVLPVARAATLLASTVRTPPDRLSTLAVTSPLATVLRSVATKAEVPALVWPLATTRSAVLVTTTPAVASYALEVAIGVVTPVKLTPSAIAMLLEVASLPVAVARIALPATEALPVRVLVDAAALSIIRLTEELVLFAAIWVVSATPLVLACRLVTTAEPVMAGAPPASIEMPVEAVLPL